MNTFFHWLCNPIFLFVILTLTALVARLMKRLKWSLGLFVGAIGWMILAGSTPLPQWLIYTLENEYKPFALADVKPANPPYILILGGGHTISPELPAGHQLSGTAVVRLAEGIRVRRLLGHAKLVCSGSSATQRTTQAEMLARAAVDLGVVGEDTIQLRSPTRTSDELRAFKARLGASPVIVVTSARHLPRVMLICKQEGLSVIPAPTDYLLKKDPQVSMFEFYPSVNKLAMMESALHEYLGMAELQMRGFFK